MLFTNKIKSIVNEIDLFFDAIAEGSLLLQPTLEAYLKGKGDIFEEKLAKISKLESDADKISKSVETQLYRRSLLPEHRGDILGLLENTDTVLDTIKKTVKMFSIENPVIPELYHEDILCLADVCAKSADEFVLAARAFFRDPNSVNQHIHKVNFYEREADQAGERIKRKVFNSDLDLAQKLHIRYAVSNIEKISDASENVAARLSIYAIKRIV